MFRKEVVQAGTFITDFNFWKRSWLSGHLFFDRIDMVAVDMDIAKSVNKITDFKTGYFCQN